MIEDVLKTLSYSVIHRHSPYHHTTTGSGVPPRRKSMTAELDMPAYYAYTACIMKKHSVQYTIRNIPERTDQLLRESAVAYGTSLNEVALSALTKGVGASGETVVHHDLDDVIGSWVNDPECDKALTDMDKVDAELWK